MATTTTTSTTTTTPTPHDETATIQFMQWSDLYLTEKPFQMFIDLPADAEDQRSTNAVFEHKKVHIRDIRGREADFDLDNQGFMIRRVQGVPLLERLDTQTIEGLYLPFVERLIREEVEGVDRVHFFDWRLRKAETTSAAGESIDLKDLSVKLGTANHAHIDQAPVAALNRVTSELAEDAEQLLKGRVRIINVWKPIQHSVTDWPLAVCDGSTFPFEDLVETDTVRQDYIGSNMFAQHRDHHDWYYLHHHRADEAMFFKQFDSESGVKARFCPHASFKHGLIDPSLPVRESIEVRALVFTNAVEGE